jgi:hypothetical protein
LVFGLVDLWGFSRQNRSDRFGKPDRLVWSKVCFGGDILGTSLPLIEEALVQVSSSFALVLGF